MAEWAEVQRLAADFKLAQISGTVQRLSERNCVEIVQRLQHLGLIDVIYTTDGKEYLTPQELAKEIKEELIVRGGRINLVELQQALNVDLNHIEAKAAEVVKGDPNLTIILGQIIDKSYLDSIAETINDQLQEHGQVTVADLTKTYDLPGNFLAQTILERLGTIIKGQVDDFDRNVIFTEAFVARHRAKIRGAFSAVTKPTSLGNMMNALQLQERLFHSILEELISSGRLAGSISGGRKDQGQFIPDIYTRAQNEWVDNFYKQNGYLEYDALVRLGIADAKSFIQKRLRGEPLQYLSSCCVGRAIQENIEAEIEEALSSSGWVDILPSMPSICTPSDAANLLQKLVKTKSRAHVFCDTIVASDIFVTNCRKPFVDLMKSKAEEVARTNPGLLTVSSPDSTKKSGPIEDTSKDDKKDQRRKKAMGSNKSGGGTQGREVKMKSTKKKGGRGRDAEDSDEEVGAAGGPSSGRGKGTDMEFMDMEALEEVLKTSGGLGDCPEDFVTEIATQLYRPLNKEFTEMAKSVFLQTQGTATGTARKKTHGELSEKINGLWSNAKLFDRANKLFPDEVQSHLNKHLLHTVCSDITNLIFNAVASDNMMSVADENQITPEMRLKMLSKMPDNKTKAILTKLNASITGKSESVEEFFTYVDNVCSPAHLEIILKKADKKKERQLLFSHRQALADQLRGEADLAMALHLASVLMFQVFTGSMVHAPGRCVPQIISYLKGHVTEEQHAILHRCQEVVVQQLKQQSEDSSPAEGSDGGEDLCSEIIVLLPKVKDMALSARKGGASPQDDA